MNPRSSQPGPGQVPRDPSVATFLTWFLPGAGHLYLGRTRSALVGFLTVQGLYLVGWLLSGGRAFEFLDPELRGTFSTLLTPEAGNLGAMILQLKLVGFGGALPHPFPPGIHLGSLCCSLSGMANACVMVHANLEARRPAGLVPAGPHPAWLVAAAWTLPGGGHLLQGRKLRGLLVFLLLVGLFAAGTFLAEGSNLSRERHFYYWSGQFLLGLPAILTELASGHPSVTGDLAHGDVGLLYASLAGLLNVLAMLDVYRVAEARWLGQAAPQEGAFQAPGVGRAEAG